MRTIQGRTKLGLGALAIAALTIGVGAQQGPPPGGRGPGGPGGPGGFGGFNMPERELVKQFDKDGDKKLNASERKAAREMLASEPARGGFGGRGFGPGGNAGPAAPGPKVEKASVKPVPASVPLFDANTMRTVFFDFENADWEAEMAAFKNTDIEVPATMTMDGKAYKDVGMKFRGASSFMMVPEGRKRSLNVTMDAFVKDQAVLGFDSLNLLNSNGDPTYVKAILYLQAAREYLPAARANFVRVVINDELWGVYASVEQVNKTFLKQWYKTDAGTRIKVPGSPGGRGGLEYWENDLPRYKQTFEMKSKDDPKAWDALVNLTKVLNTTPPEQLEKALAPILDVDGALRFLALDNALVNTDGYWVRASDYNIYLDPTGKFHILPHDTNETFGPPGGGRGGPGPGGPGFGPGGPGGPGRGPMDSARRRRAADAAVAAAGAAWVRVARRSIPSSGSKTLRSRCAPSCWPCPRCARSIWPTRRRSRPSGSTGRRSSRS